MLKKTLISFAVLVIIVLGGALIAPSFIDWNARLPEITAQVKNATGRTLTIDGHLEVRLLPSPMLTARGVKLGNAPGGRVPHMAALEAVEVRVALMPLLSGQVKVERIRLVKPQIFIEKFADGRTNLEFQGVSSQKVSSVVASSGSGSDSSGLGVQLDNFEIINATVLYEDLANGTVERVEDINTTLRAASLKGPFEIQGEARLRGVPLSFEASLGRIISGRTVPINAVIKAQGGTRVQIGGAALDIEISPYFKGKIKAEGESLAGLLSAVSDHVEMSPPLHQPFLMEMAVKASASEVALSDLELSLGAVRAFGNAKLEIADGLNFNVNMKASRIDADALLSMKSSPTQRVTSRNVGGVISPKPPKNGGADTDGGFVLPHNVRGTLALSVDAVTYKGELVSDVRLNAELAGGELVLSQFQLQAPGVTDIALFGFIKPEAGQPRFNGDLEVITANPRGLADWLGIEMPAGVAGRLKRMTFKTQVVADQKQIALSNLELTGDRTQVTGGVTVALRSRPSFGADLNVNALNLDTYAKAANATVASSQPQSKMSQAMGLASLWSVTSVLNEFDANVKVRMGRLTTGGHELNGLVFDGTLYAGSLELRQLKMDSFLGMSSNIAGSFSGFGGVPEMTGVKAVTKIKNVNALATALGLKGLPKKIGALTFKARAHGSLLKPKFNLDLAALGAQVNAAGRMSFLPIGFGWNGPISIKHENVAKLFKRLGYAPTGPLGAMDMQAKVQTDGVNYKITDIDGSIGKMPLAGQVMVSTSGARPNVVANLTSGVLDIQHFLAKTDQRADASLTPHPFLILASAPQVAQSASRVSKRWSREAFDLSALNAIDGELTLKSTAIKFGDYRLDNADIHATVQGGVMTADRVVGSVFGGPVSATALVRGEGQPTLESTLKLKAMNVGRAVKAIAGKDLASGRLGLDLRFHANGNSPAALVGSLAGAGGLKIDALDVKQGGQGTALAPVIGLVMAMKQFSLPGLGGKKGGLADLTLSFDIVDGVANANNLSLNSAFGKGKGAGKVDIAAWLIDFDGEMTVEPNLITSLLSKGRMGAQVIPFSLKGPLDKPSVKLAVQPAQPRAPQSTPQAPPGTLAPPPPQNGGQPQQPQGPLSPEDMIKQLMLGL